MQARYVASDTAHRDKIAYDILYAITADYGLAYCYNVVEDMS